MCEKDRRLTRGMLQKLNRSNATDASSKKSLSPNSIILINDSDSETESVKENDNETNNSDKKDTSVCIIESTSKPSLSVQQKRKLETSEQNKPLKRPSIIPLDNDSSVFHMSDVKDSLLNGNIGESPLFEFLSKKGFCKGNLDLILF